MVDNFFVASADSNPIIFFLRFSLFFVVFFSWFWPFDIGYSYGDRYMIGLQYLWSPYQDWFAKQPDSAAVLAMQEFWVIRKSRLLQDIKRDAKNGRLEAGEGGPRRGSNQAKKTYDLIWNVVFDFSHNPDPKVSPAHFKFILEMPPPTWITSTWKCERQNL